MKEKKELTDAEKLDVLNKRLKHIQYSTDIQTAIVIIGFLGVISMGVLIAKVKDGVKKVL
jgi:hypothetical protein